MSRGLAGLFALMSWAAPLVLPFAALTPGDGHGCTEQVCRCAHRAPATPSPEACHGRDAAPANCQMSATCSHELASSLVTAPLYEAPAAAPAPSPSAEGHDLPPAAPARVRHGFARLEPHPPPAL